MSRPSRFVLAAVLMLFSWMMLSGWSDDSTTARIGIATFVTFMLALALGLIAPTRFRIALRFVAGVVALTYIWYFVSEVAALLGGEPQTFRWGEPSALMAGLGLLVFGVPAIAFALGGVTVGWLDRLMKRMQGTPRQVAAGLRAQALARTPGELGITSTPEHPHVFGILMETGFSRGVATLVAFADGSASLYFSTGGGVIGAGEHAPVRVAVGVCLAAAETHFSAFALAQETPLPAKGRVRFYVRTFEGTLWAEADEQELGHMQHPLSPVFHAGHAVIGALRELDKAGAP